MKNSYITWVLLIIIVAGIGLILLKSFNGNDSGAFPVVTLPADGNATTTQNATSTDIGADGDDVVLAFGQKTQVGDLVITLNSLVQDSRCPIDVQCIQAGSVSVNATLTHQIHTETRNISSNGSPYSFHGYTISLNSVEPAKESKKQLSPSDYRITFHISSDAAMGSSDMQ